MIRVIILNFIIFIMIAPTLVLSQEKTSIIIPGVSVDNIEIGKATFDEIIKKYGHNYLIDTVFSNNNENEESIKNEIYSIKICYDSLGILFSRFPYNDEIFSINIKHPFNGKTSNGIVLNESTFKDVERLFGKTGWAFVEYTSILKMYDGIRFYTKSNSDWSFIIEEEETLLNGKINEISIHSEKRKINKRKAKKK